MNDMSTTASGKLNQIETELLDEMIDEHPDVTRNEGIRITFWIGVGAICGEPGLVDRARQQMRAARISRRTSRRRSRQHGAEAQVEVQPLSRATVFGGRGLDSGHGA